MKFSGRLPVIALVTFPLTAHGAFAAASPAPPTAPRTAAATPAQSAKLKAILAAKKDAYAACGDPDSVPAPPKMEGGQPRNIKDAVAAANLEYASTQATEKILACQQATIQAALPDLKKTGATQAAISGAIDAFRASFRKPASPPAVR